MIVKSKQLNDLTRVYYVENHRSWKKVSMTDFRFC